LFVGKLDDWETMRAGVPSALPVIRLPLAPMTDGERWDAIIGRTPPLQGEPDRALDELATIVYTSGSTGHPKGVMQSFRAFNVIGARMPNTAELSPDDRMLSYLPLAHVAERVAVQNQSTYYGFQVFFADSLDTFLDDLRRARPTIFFSVPRLWTKFQLGVRAKLSERKEAVLFRVPLLGRRIKRKILAQLGLADVRLALTGAAPLPPEILTWYRELGLELLEGYGMSENMAYSHLTKVGEARAGYVGHANDGVECKIGEGGEVLVKSPAQMMGYYKQPELTAGCYTDDGFFKTGDMGEIDAQGRLRITGRVKDLFKTSKGKYVAPVPIENRLGAHPLVESALVAGANQTSPFAVLVLSEEARSALASGSSRQAVTAELEALLARVNEGADPHEHLAFIVVAAESWTVDNGLLTPTLKIRRAVLERHYEPEVAGWFAERRSVIFQADLPLKGRAGSVEAARRQPTPQQL
jgi:long-subunit acyl-CoA synthetase (AMP-forming)